MNGTNFRPNDDENQRAIDKLKEIFKLEKLKIVHGHDGVFNGELSKDVININARKRSL
jgi:hypothetical protein